MFAEAFAAIAQGFSASFGGPFYPGKLHWPGSPVYDDGGSIVTPGAPVEHDCMVQIDAVTEAMRLQEGFTEKDVRIIILAPALARPVDTDAEVEVLPGPAVPVQHVGRWSIQSETMDAVGCAFDGRGRRV